MNSLKGRTIVGGMCFLVGIGGLGGACDTGKGFFISGLLLAIGAVLEYCSYF